MRSSFRFFLLLAAQGIKNSRVKYARPETSHLRTGVAPLAPYDRSSASRFFRLRREAYYRRERGGDPDLSTREDEVEEEILLNARGGENVIRRRWAEVRLRS